MPSKQEKTPSKKISTSPSPGLLERIFGSGQLSPEMQQGIEIAKRENPNLAPVQPYGFFSRMMQPNAMAYASPGQTIYMNPATNAGQNPQDIADTLTHEQTHVNQMRARGNNPLMEFFHTLTQPRDLYHQRPDEMEAFRAEEARRSRMGRLQTGMPEFTTGMSRAPQDIMLSSRAPKIDTTPTRMKNATK